VRSTPIAPSSAAAAFSTAPKSNLDGSLRRRSPRVRWSKGRSEAALSGEGTAEPTAERMGRGFMACSRRSEKNPYAAPKSRIGGDQMTRLAAQRPSRRAERRRWAGAVGHASAPTRCSAPVPAKGSGSPVSVCLEAPAPHVVREVQTRVTCPPCTRRLLRRPRLRRNRLRPARPLVREHDARPLPLRFEDR
jgi:hypothetical protein